MDIVPSQVRHLEKVTYKKAFVEAKVMVDRHNLITTVFFVSHKTKTKIKKFEGITGRECKKVSAQATTSLSPISLEDTKEAPQS